MEICATKEKIGAAVGSVKVAKALRDPFPLKYSSETLF